MKRDEIIEVEFIEDLMHMSDIADSRDISRERVRQILEKRGVNKHLRHIVHRIRHVVRWKCESCGREEWRYGSKQPKTCGGECQIAMLSDANRIPDEDLEEEMVRLSRYYDRPPTIDEMNAKGEYSHQSYVRRWGTWTNAQEAIGVTENGDDES